MKTYSTANGNNIAFRQWQPPAAEPALPEPAGVEAEEAVLSAVLVDPDNLAELATFLKPEDFYIERHAWIYEACLSLYRRSRPLDLVGVADELGERLEEAGGESFLISLVGNIHAPSSHAAYYARMIERDSLRRQLIRAAGEVARIAYAGGEEIDDILARSEKAVSDIASRRAGEKAQLISSVVDEIYSDVETISQSRGRKIIGLPTGLNSLDKILGGLQKGQFIVVAGRPGMGKTSLGLQIPLYLAEKWGKRSMVFSLEMSKKELVRRMLSAKSGIEESRIKTAQFSDYDWVRYYEAMKIVSPLPIMIDDSSTLTASSLRARVMQEYSRTGLDLVVVDYLQLMDGEDSRRRWDSRQQEVTEISRTCKKIARELNIPVVALSQLSRKCEERGDKRPVLSDLRDSGAIEQDSDVVIFLYREVIYKPDTEFPNIAEAIIAKHRSGPTGVVSLFYKSNLTYFADLEEKVIPLETI